MQNNNSTSSIPPVLYKYRSIESERTNRILSHGEIYFCPPERLNDPCEYFFKFKQEQGEIYYTNTTYAELDTLQVTGYDIKHMNPNGSIMIGMSPDQKAIYFHRYLLRHNSRGIFSLCSANDAFLMHSFYGNGFKGICIGFEWEKFELEFDGSDPQQINLPRKIQYSDTPPLVVGTPDEWLTTFTTKSCQFAFESEWRMFYRKGVLQSDKIKKAIKSITFGHKCLEMSDWNARLNKIIEWTNDFDIKFFVAIPIDGEYKINILRLDYCHGPC